MANETNSSTGNSHQKKVDPAIEVYCSKLEGKVCGLSYEGKNYSNFPLEEINALKQLKCYKDIVIKEADKGSTVV